MTDMTKTRRIGSVDFTTRKRAQAYAAKFLTETVLGENHEYVEPTNVNLANAFRNCSVSPRPGMYDLIRAEFWTMYHNLKAGKR